MSSTPSLAPMTSATTRPIGVFISVTPHMLENSVADPNCMRHFVQLLRRVSSSIDSSSGCELVLGGVEAGSEGDDLLGRLRPDRLQRARGVQAARHPGGQPARRAPCWPRRTVSSRVKQPEQVPGVGQIAVVVVLTGAHDRRGDVVAVAGGDLHHQLAAEQLTRPAARTRCWWRTAARTSRRRR